MVGDTSPGQARSWERQMTFFCRFNPKLTTACGEKHRRFVFLVLQPGCSFSHHLTDQKPKLFFQFARKTGFRADLVTSLLEHIVRRFHPPKPPRSCPQSAVVSSAGGTKVVVVGSCRLRRGIRLRGLLEPGSGDGERGPVGLQGGFPRSVRLLGAGGFSTAPVAPGRYGFLRGVQRCRWHGRVEGCLGKVGDVARLGRGGGGWGSGGGCSCSVWGWAEQHDLPSAGATVGVGRLASLVETFRDGSG